MKIVPISKEFAGLQRRCLPSEVKQDIVFGKVSQFKIGTMEVNLTTKTTAESAEIASATATLSSFTTEAFTSNAAPVAATSSKTLKRCLSVPVIQSLPPSSASGNVNANFSTSMRTRSAAAAAAAAAHQNSNNSTDMLLDTPKKCQNSTLQNDITSGHNIHGYGGIGGNSAINIGVPRSNPSSREVSPAPVFNIFAPRARRYSASYSPLGSVGGNIAVGVAAAGSNSSAPLRLTPRVSQLRQEECIDINSREVNHEREVHSAMQMSQSWEDLTLVTENWSCKSDEFSNPLQVSLPSGVTSCSSPSPTSNRAGLRLPYGLSPSPTRRTFATRRSMSPIAMRPSQLGPVKRKFELDDNNSSNWNVYSPPPLKKITTESRGSSPICQSPSSVCPSPDSGTYDGRNTPKLFISKLCTTNTNSCNSACSSPMSTQTTGSLAVNTIESTANSVLCSSSSSSSSGSLSASSSVCGGSEPMCVGNNIDEGISISETDDKPQCTLNTMQRMSTDMQDEATLMDDIKSETSSIGGFSSISVESSSCDSGAKAAASFLNKLMMDDGVALTTSQPINLNKNFIINKQGLSGAKKFIVNHNNLPNCSSSFSNSCNIENMDSTSGSANNICQVKTTNVEQVTAQPKM